MESLIEEDSTPSKSGASKRKLKKDRRLKRQEAEMETEMSPPGEVTWDEDQELSLLTQMGWSKCQGSTCGSVSGAAEEGREDGGAASPVDAAVQLALDASASGAEAEEEARLKLQLSAQEWEAWEQKKEDLLEQRQRLLFSELGGLVPTHESLENDLLLCHHQLIVLQQRHHLRVART